jgi:hypothetical protein
VQVSSAYKISLEIPSAWTVAIPPGTAHSDLIWWWGAPGGIACWASDHFGHRGAAPVLPCWIDWQLLGGTYIGDTEESPGQGASTCAWDPQPIAEGTTFLTTTTLVEGLLWRVRAAGTNSWLLRARNSSAVTLTTTISARRLLESVAGGLVEVEAGSIIK